MVPIPHESSVAAMLPPITGRCVCLFERPLEPQKWRLSLASSAPAAASAAAAVTKGVATVGEAAVVGIPGAPLGAPLSLQGPPRRRRQSLSPASATPPQATAPHLAPRSVASGASSGYALPVPPSQSAGFGALDGVADEADDALGTPYPQPSSRAAEVTPYQQPGRTFRSASPSRKRRSESSGASGASGAAPFGAASSGPSVAVNGGGALAKVAAGPRLLYVAQFGNNSPLVRTLLRGRPGWAPGPGDPGHRLSQGAYEERLVKLRASDELPEVQFVWTQWGVQGVFDAMASQDTGMCVILNEEPKLQVQHRPYRLAASGPAAGSKAAPSSPKFLPRLYNHFEGNAVLCTKDGLRDTMVKYYLAHGRDPFAAVPITYVVREGSGDEQLAEWRRCFDRCNEECGQKIWLVKPGGWANRGCGIRIYDVADEVEEHVKSKKKVWIVQKYLEHPLLVHKRKFDIRAYCLVTQDPNGGDLKAYCYQQAYLRTTSSEYTTKTLDRLVHLNNDAVQKKGESYGKFESANKLSLQDFQRYLDEHHAQDRVRVEEHLMPQMRGLMADAVCAAAGRLNPRKIDHCFEVFGFDFMIDEAFKLWMIEVNANPCLELCNALLSQLIPRMLDEALQMTLDCVYPTAAGFVGQGCGKRGECIGGWEEIFRGAASSEAGGGDVHCTWLPRLPAGASAANLAALGRECLAPTPPFARGEAPPELLRNPNSKPRRTRPPC